MISISTIKSLLYENDEKPEIINRNRTILLRHASDISNWISTWNVGDIFKNNGQIVLPDYIISFDK